MVATQKEKIVFPGEFLTTEEEFVGGANTFIDNNGCVRALAVGAVKFDQSKREVTVTSHMEARPIEAGATVIGRITLVKESVAFVEIQSAELNGKKLKVTNNLGAILISEVDDMYIENLSDMFKVGDIVKAKVLEVKPYGISLTTKGGNFGIIKAFCVKCRKPMYRIGNILKCINCGSTSKRKLARDYLLSI